MFATSPLPLVWAIITAILFAGCALAVSYLVHVNRLLKGIPDQIRKLSGPRWTTEQLRRTYDELSQQPIDYTSKIPPRLDRRYIVTGGNGLVGGFIVLQLLARGTPPSSIRILDIRQSEREDMATDAVAEVDFVQTDIRSTAAVAAAFEKPWDPTVSHLPLTVFHTAAVILASDRSEFLYGFPHAVNVKGTENVMFAAKAAGADVFSATSSASISVRPVNPWVSYWAKQPKNYCQLMDERDFDQPPKAPEDFFGNYPRSKSSAERFVCAANSDGFRTGCIRPANGVYGNPTDNTVGGPLSKTVVPTWVPHIVQSFVHAANVAIAHLQHEAVLISNEHPDSAHHGGRPFVVTDPNPPISYSDLYQAISTLSIHPFRVLILPPAIILCLSHIIEWYNLLPYRAPWLRKFVPEIKGETRHLQPGLISICTHLIGLDAEARKPVAQGGLGYEGVMTTMQGMALEILEWNREHGQEGKNDDAGVISNSTKKLYTTSVALADQLRLAMTVDGSVGM